MKYLILVIVLFSLLGCADKPCAEPILIVHKYEDPGEYLTLEYAEEEDAIFTMTKEIYCSDDPYAKRLVAKYNIKSDTIKCEDDPWMVISHRTKEPTNEH